MRVGADVIMKSASDCAVCGPGTFCPVGSKVVTNCSAGTFNDREKQASCSKCVAGTFQNAEGATAGGPQQQLLPSSLRKELFAVCEHVRRELEAGPPRLGKRQQQQQQQQQP